MSSRSLARAGLLLVVVCGASFAGCGKRGDPLPPRRPFPGAAEGLVVRQVGDRVRLEWRAPTRNTDGTTEKLELAEVEIRRRIVDIEALVEAQTKPYEPKETETSPPSDEEPGAELVEEPEAAEPADRSPLVEPSVETPAAAEPATTELPSAEGASEDASDSASEGQEDDEEDVGPVLPPIPMLVIPDFAPESRPVTTVASTEPNEDLTYEEPIDPEWIGKRVEYAVVYINQRHRRSPRTPVAQIEPVPPLPAPGRPSAAAGDGFVQITWTDSALDVAADEDPRHYAVFRRAESAEDYPDRPVNPTATSALEHRDRQAPFGVGSCYVVRAVNAPPKVEPLESELARELARSGVEPSDDVDVSLATEAVEAVELDLLGEVVETVDPVVLPEFIVPEVPAITTPVRIESMPSEEVCLVPVDTFALPAPTGLVAVATDDNILLTWDSSDHADARGYRVYRSDPESGEAQLISEALVPRPSFTDTDVSPGMTYSYAVSVVDDAREPNESARSVASEVRFQP